MEVPMQPEDTTPIPDFPGYAITRDGRVWSAVTQRWLRHGIGKAGYPLIRPCRDGKAHSRHIHRLVLLTFCGPPGPGQVCRHLDGDPLNCRLENLRWGTVRENMADKINHGTTTRGDRNGSHLHPERYPRGNDHYARREPERLARGEQHGQAKITAEAVRELCALRAAGWSLSALSARFGISKPTVSAIMNGRLWQHVTGLERSKVSRRDSAPQG
jgi:hypothetical protein